LQNEQGHTPSSSGKLELAIGGDRPFQTTFDKHFNNKTAPFSPPLAVTLPNPKPFFCHLTPPTHSPKSSLSKVSANPDSTQRMDKLKDIPKDEKQGKQFDSNAKAIYKASKKAEKPERNTAISERLQAIKAVMAFCRVTKTKQKQLRQEQKQTRKEQHRYNKLIQQTKRKTANASIFFNLDIQGTSIKFLHDSGAHASILSKTEYDKLQGPFADADPEEQKFTLIDHQQRIIPQQESPKKIPITINDKTIFHTFYITTNGESLCGLDLQEELNMNLHARSSGTFITINGKEIPTTQVKHNLLPNTALTTDEVTVPGYSKYTVNCVSRIVSNTHTTKKRHKPFLSVAHSTSSNNPIQIKQQIFTISPNKIIHIDIVNQTSETLTIPKGFHIAELTPRNDITTKHTHRVDCTDNDNIKFDTIDFNLEEEPSGYDIPQGPQKTITEAVDETDLSTVPSHLLSDFKNFLLTEAKEVISLGETDIGKAKCEPVNIELADPNLKLNQAPYRANNVRRQQLNKSMKKLVEQKILKEGYSDTTSPAFLIGKKADDTGAAHLRAVIDYRQVNLKTKEDTFPLPDIPYLLNQLQGADYYTTIDVRAAFHSIPLTEEAQRLCAIVTEDGTFLPQRLPYGLKQASGIFIRILSQLLGVDPDRLAFVDDLILHTRGTPEDHMRAVKRTIKKLVDSGFKINLRKANFFKTEVKFLGKVINRDGTKPNPEHVQAIKDFPVPQSIKQLQSWLGLALYTSKYLENFSIDAAPLFQLTSANTFHWTFHHQQCFEKNKKQYYIKQFSVSL
jgi:hypothetical protein